LLASVVLLAGSAEPTLAGSATTSSDPVLAAAGDVAESGGHQQATGDLIRSLSPTAVLPLGDEAYPDGTLGQFNSYYRPAWGSFNAIARPTPRWSTVSRMTRPRTARGPPGRSSVHLTIVPSGHDSAQMTWMPLAEISIARA